MDDSQLIQKIAVIGNIAGGKTWLARRLAQIHNLPLTHVDSIHFLPGLKIRPTAEARELILEIENQTSWIIDGYGPLDLIEKRFAKADRLVLVDLPLARHLWWCSKRQIKNLFTKREELPEACNEASWQHTQKLFQTLWKMHLQMRPELLRILAREPLREKVISIHSLSELKFYSLKGLT